MVYNTQIRHLHDVIVAMAGWPKACHTLAHGVPWDYIMGLKIWLKACHILTHGSPWGQILYSHDVDAPVLCHMARHEQ